MNTAPRAVLGSLLPASEIPSEAVEALLRFRNEKLETEESEAAPTAEAELGLEEENPPTKYFSTLDEMDQVPEFGNLFPEVKQRFKQLLTTQSEVFTVWITARILSQESGGDLFEGLSRPGLEEEGVGLSRRIRAVVLRRDSDSGVEILPIVRWEVRSDRHIPIPDFPPEEMPR